MSCRHATSKHSCSTSAIRGERLRVETKGVATSASWARASRDISPAEAKTILIWLGRCWRKSSHRNLLSGLVPAASPSRCCIQRKSCDGFLSPNSSTVTNVRKSRPSSTAFTISACVRSAREFCYWNLVQTQFINRSWMC